MKISCDKFYVGFVSYSNLVLGDTIKGGIKQTIIYPGGKPVTNILFTYNFLKSMYDLKADFSFDVTLSLNGIVNCGCAFIYVDGLVFQVVSNPKTTLFL